MRYAPQTLLDAKNFDPMVEASLKESRRTPYTSHCKVFFAGMPPN